MNPAVCKECGLRSSHARLHRVEDVSVNTLVAAEADVRHRHQLLVRWRDVVLVVVQFPRLGFQLFALCFLLLRQAYFLKT